MALWFMCLAVWDCLLFKMLCCVDSDWLARQADNRTPNLMLKIYGFSSRVLSDDQWSFAGVGVLGGTQVHRSRGPRGGASRVGQVARPPIPPRTVVHGLFELRHVGKLNTRVLWFFVRGRRIIAVHGIRNKGQSIPGRDLDTARERITDWRKRFER
jgi:Phage derived protein Gp49-like (DUF891)